MSEATRPSQNDSVEAADDSGTTDRPGETSAGPVRAGDLLHLTSRQNARVKDVARLARRREREATGVYLAEGANAVEAALAAGAVQTIFLRDSAFEDHDVDAWRSAGVEVVLVTGEVLSRLADATTPQPVLAVARQRRAALADVVGTGTLVVLEEPNDPGNLGTIIRTADASGAAAVVLVGHGVDAFHPKVVRASAGSLLHVPIVRAASVAEVAEAAHARGQRLVGLALEGTRSVFVLEQEPDPVALVFGTERHGLRPASREACDELLRIPQFGRAESLNLGVAAGITMYAAARARPEEPRT